MQRSSKMKEIMKKMENFTILFINQHVYEKLNCLTSNWASHLMNNNIIYEESFNSTKKARVSRDIDKINETSNLILITSSYQ
jgi:hypothetical protein